MVVGLVRSINSLRYGGLYLPLLSLVHIRSITPGGFNHTWPSFALRIADWEYMWAGYSISLSQWEFGFLFLFSFLGAALTHGALESIFGPEGPKANPKKSWTVLYHKWALMLSDNPPADLLDAGGRFESYLETLQEEWQRNLIGKYAAIKSVTKKSLKFFTFSFSSILLSLTVYVTTLIYLDLVWRNGLDLVGIGLFLAQVSFFFAPKISNRFPTVVPRNSAEWVRTPEYKKAPTLHEEGKIEIRGESDNIVAHHIYNLKDHMDSDAMREDISIADGNYLIPLDEDPED